MAELPTLYSEAPGTALTRWLRIGGFRVLPLRTDAPPLAPGGPDVYRITPAAADGSPSADTMLVPRDDWRQAFGTVVRRLGVDFEALNFLRVCPTCGAFHEYLERAEAPPTTPPHVLRIHATLLRCTGCSRVSWAGDAHQERVRRLRDLYLEHLFRCTRCGTEDGEAEGRNLARVEIRCGLGPMVISEAELARDQTQDIARLLLGLELTDPEEAADEVAFHRDQPLCDRCRRGLVALLRDYFRASTLGSEGRPR